MDYLLCSKSLEKIILHNTKLRGYVIEMENGGYNASIDKMRKNKSNEMSAEISITKCISLRNIMVICSKEKTIIFKKRIEVQDMLFYRNRSMNLSNSLRNQCLNLKASDSNAEIEKSQNFPFYLLNFEKLFKS